MSQVEITLPKAKAVYPTVTFSVSRGPGGFIIRGTLPSGKMAVVSEHLTLKILDDDALSVDEFIARHPHTEGFWRDMPRRKSGSRRWSPY